VPEIRITITPIDALNRPLTANTNAQVAIASMPAIGNNSEVCITHAMNGVPATTFVKLAGWAVYR